MSIKRAGMKRHFLVIKGEKYESANGMVVEATGTGIVVTSPGLITQEEMAAYVHALGFKVKAKG